MEGWDVSDPGRPYRHAASEEPCTEQEVRITGLNGGVANGFLLHTCNHFIWARCRLWRIRGDKSWVVPITSRGFPISHFKAAEDWKCRHKRQQTECGRVHIASWTRPVPSGQNRQFLQLLTSRPRGTGTCKWEQVVLRTKVAPGDRPSESCGESDSH